MGTLYLCATPIGNLDEMNSRCIKTLAEADIICAEDTRHSLKLLNHFNITAKRLLSYHEHNKEMRHEYLLNALDEGKSVALISDAGYPGICDPGEVLVALAAQKGHSIVTINGANAMLCALVASGLPTKTFYFAGFLPKSKKHRRSELEILNNLATTLILYEAPHRIIEVLEDVLSYLGDRKIAIARELTKLHEEFFRGNVSEAINWLHSQQLRGEFVLVLSSRDFSGLDTVTNISSDEFSVAQIPAIIEDMLGQGMDKKQAITALAKRLKIPKKTVYNAVINAKNEERDYE